MRQSPTLATIGVLGVLTLGACANPLPEAGMMPTTEQDAPAGAEQPEYDPNLPNCELQPWETDFAPFAANSRAPVLPPEGAEPTEEPPQFYFTITENQFDACADLSWITLTGSTTDPDDPAPDPAARDSSSAVVFFHRNQLITDPLPVQVAANPYVQYGETTKTTATPTVQMNFGHYAPPGEAVTMEIRQVTFSWDNDRLTLDDEDWFRNYGESRMRLDLNPR